MQKLVTLLPECGYVCGVALFGIVSIVTFLTTLFTLPPYRLRFFFYHTCNSLLNSLEYHLCEMIYLFPLSCSTCAVRCASRSAPPAENLTYTIFLSCTATVITSLCVEMWRSIWNGSQTAWSLWKWLDSFTCLTKTLMEWNRRVASKWNTTIKRYEVLKKYQKR